MREREKAVVFSAGDISDKGIFGTLCRALF